MRFTDQGVRSLPHTETGQREYGDDAVPGLSLIVGKSTKTFRLVIGTGGSRTRFTLGRYDPPRYTLGMAREAARDIIARERLHRTAGPHTTYSDALKLYERTHLSQLRPASARNIERALNRSFGKLAKMPLIDIRRTDISPILDMMLATPAAMASNFRYLRAFLNWCVERGYIEHAPTSRMKGPKAVPSRERVLSTLELTAIWQAAPENDFGRILKLLLLSGQRREQWAAVRREYIQGELIVWPAHAMKSNKPHSLPLTSSMRALLSDRVGYLFPNSSGKPFDNWTRNKERLDEDCGVTEWRLHDLRRTWATTVADELNIEPHIIESVLAHATGTPIARIYNRARYVERMRKALLAFAEWLDTQLSKSEEGNGGYHDTRGDPGIHHETA